MCEFFFLGGGGGGLMIFAASQKITCQSVFPYFQPWRSCIKFFQYHFFSLPWGRASAIAPECLLFCCMSLSFCFAHYC